jgi:hypothetical protein
MLLSCAITSLSAMPLYRKGTHPKLLTSAAGRAGPTHIKWRFKGCPKRGGGASATNRRTMSGPRDGSPSVSAGLTRCARTNFVSVCKTHTFSNSPRK